MRQKKIYLAGPMTGIFEFNFSEFDRHRDELLEQGYIVFSPADNDRELLGKPKDWYPGPEDHDGEWLRWTTPGAPDLRKILGDDIAWIAQHADAIYLMKGWEKSSGARVEFELARALNLEFIYG